MIKKFDFNGNIFYMSVGRKSGKPYGRVYPIKKDIDKPLNFENINWFNALTGGSWFNVFIIVMYILSVIFMIYWATSNVEKLVSCFDSIGNLEVCKKTYGGDNLFLNFTKSDFFIGNYSEIN
jgi:hypothetical protein